MWRVLHWSSWSDTVQHYTKKKITHIRVDTACPNISIQWKATIRGWIWPFYSLFKLSLTSMTEGDSVSDIWGCVCEDYALNLLRDDCLQTKLPKASLKTDSPLLHCGAFSVMFVFLFILAALFFSPGRTNSIASCETRLIAGIGINLIIFCEADQ